MESNKYNKLVNKTRSRLIDMENKLVAVSGERVGGGTTLGQGPKKKGYYGIR